MHAMYTLAERQEAPAYITRMESPLPVSSHKYLKNRRSIMMQKDLYKRLARVEAMANAQKAELMETLWRMYETACSQQDAQQAAALVRKIRNRLLDNTDKEMSLDRLGLDTSSAATFIASLIRIFNGDWAQYRQASSVPIS